MDNTFNSFMEIPDQLGYVQCGFCTTILLVSVPHDSRGLVTVKCGHCECLLSVSLDIQPASFLPIQLITSLGVGNDYRNVEAKQQPTDDALHKACKSEADVHEEKHEEKTDEDEEDDTPLSSITQINKPPEKKQRAPSAYNQFIKEEIQRIKAIEPHITHKEAFSAAAKNWSHCPRLHYKQQRKGDGASCSRASPIINYADVEEDNRTQVDCGRKISMKSII